MATHTSCDYCGETMEDRDSFTMQLSGRQDGRFYYWTEADLHPDCWHKIREGLQLALDAGGSIERIPTQGETPTVREGHAPDTPNSAPEVWEVRLAKAKAWKALDHDQRVPFILDAIGTGRRTFREISDAINTRTEFYVHEGTVRPNAMRMIEAGLVNREAEPFHGKIRYRYFLTEMSGSDREANATGDVLKKQRRVD